MFGGKNSVMGESTQFRCPECGYDFAAFTGVGFAFPRVYAETVSKMKRGRLGTTAKRFFEEHPDGAISCENIVMKCQKCGEYDSRESLAMYVPKEGFAHQVPEGIWAFAAPFEGSDYVSPDELEVCYDLYAEYPHRCRNCRGKMKPAEIFSVDEYGNETLIRPLVCPHCGAEMEEYLHSFWD